MSGSVFKTISPIVKLFQLCGLDLDWKTSGFDQNEGKLFKRFYSGFCLLINIGWNTFVLSNYFLYNLPSTIVELNTVIDSINAVFDIVGSHLALYYLVNSDIQQLFSALHQMECKLNYEDRHYRRLRRFSWIAVLGILSFVATQMSLTISRRTEKLELTNLLAVLAIDMGMIYPMTSYALFFVLGMSLASSFEHVDSMLSRHLSQVNKMTDGLALTEIRSIHGLVCRAVHRLNDSFQTLSFIHVVFVFTAVVNTSFTLIVQPRFNLIVFFYTMETFVRLWLLGYACDRIQKKASTCLTTLSEQENDLNYIGYSLLRQQQHVMFAAQVFQTVPKFDIYGLFQLSRQLVPTLIATMITYSVILYQFRST